MGSKKRRSKISSRNQTNTEEIREKDREISIFQALDRGMNIDRGNSTTLDGGTYFVKK